MSPARAMGASDSLRGRASLTSVGRGAAGAPLASRVAGPTPLAPMWMATERPRCFASAQGATGIYNLNVRKWLGTSLGPTQLWTSGFCFGAINVGDFDGDGKTDVLCEDTGAWGSPGTSGTRADLLSQVSNGIGGSTTIAYLSSTAFTNGARSGAPTTGKNRNHVRWSNRSFDHDVQLCLWEGRSTTAHVPGLPVVPNRSSMPPRIGLHQRCYRVFPDGTFGREAVECKPLRRRRLHHVDADLSLHGER